MRAVRKKATACKKKKDHRDDKEYCSAWMFRSSHGHLLSTADQTEPAILTKKEETVHGKLKKT